MALTWTSHGKEDPCFLFDEIVYDPAASYLYIKMSDAAIDDEGYRREYTYHGVPQGLAKAFIKGNSDRKISLFNERIRGVYESESEAPTRHGVEPWEPSPDH